MGLIALFQLSESYYQPRAENWALYVPRKRFFGTIVLAEHLGERRLEPTKIQRTSERRSTENAHSWAQVYNDGI